MNGLKKLQIAKWLKIRMSRGMTQEDMKELRKEL